MWCFSDRATSVRKPRFMLCMHAGIVPVAPVMARREARRRKPRRGALAVAPLDPVEAADVAGLHYINPEGIGIRRVPSGRGFVYRDRDDKLVHDEATLARIRSLAIPPAYRDVWISKDP